jgi:hypothetical protein
MSAGWYVWLGILTASNLFLIIGLVYVMWRYVYTPWKIVRKDIAALNGQCIEIRAYVDQVLTHRRSEALDDAEVAFRERQILHRQEVRRNRG